MVGKDGRYYEREQSQIKHVILDKYLERFARIVGSWAKGLIYIDAFSGPWNSLSDDLSDSSFAIACNQLRAARESVEKIYKKTVPISCVFLETDPDAFRQLESFARAQKDLEIVALNRSFESVIPDLVQFIKSKPRGYFPFVLIDPKGWKGFAMDSIRELIQLEPCEVLVNFMTGHIQRFIEDERDGVNASFRKLFGDDSFERRIEGLEGREREDAIVEAYAERLKSVGRYPYTCTTFVLQPTRDRTHYHLVYATRDVKGIQVFKEAEQKALTLSESIRSDAKRRARENRSKQLELFSGTELPDISHLDNLQEHYERLAIEVIETIFLSRTEIPYDELFAHVLRFPMVQESFVKAWVKDHAEVIGQPEKKVPQIRQNHVVRLRKKA